jgi:hypothetical protein
MGRPSILLQNGHLDRRLWRHDGRYVKLGHVLNLTVGAAPVIQPCIDFLCPWMSAEMKYFDQPIPNGLALKALSHQYALDVLRLAAVHGTYGVLQVVNMGSAVTAERLPMLQYTRGETHQSAAVKAGALRDCSATAALRRTCCRNTLICAKYV